MRNILVKLMLCIAPAALLGGCLRDTWPTSYTTASQVNSSPQAVQALANGTIGYMYAYNYFGTYSSQEFGYPAMMIIRDAMTDAPYVSTNYNHFNSYWCTLSDFTSSRGRQPWRYFYALAFNANNTMNAIGDPDTAPELVRERYRTIYGTSLVYRVLAYMDLMRMYEYKKTGVATLDAEADKNEIWGLTSVIVDENFDPMNATKNPRAPFYKMYRFILNDLDRAEKYLENYARPAKNRADVSVVDAYRARLWLEIATRFQKYPADLQTALDHEDDSEIPYRQLGVTSAADCYAKAAEYARKVIGKYTPLTREEWHSTTSGFNNASMASWIFAIMIDSPNSPYVNVRVNTFHSNCVTEFIRGYSRSQYGCYRMIDHALYDKIGEGDWRKVTWIDPADAGVNPTPAKYHTLLDDTEWAKRGAYVGFKYRPNEGDTNADDHRKALLTDFPLIRVEEMYFIEAEALAYTGGLGAGVDALTTFMNTHRYTDGSYFISPDDVEDFVDNNLITQKRIELWGEGLAFFDIKRRELPITRGYTGTNWIADNRYNSLPGYTPSWLNLYIPYESEAMINEAVKLNPDPAVKESYGLWVK